MTDQPTLVAAAKPCMFYHLRIVFKVTQFDHYTVDGSGEAAVLVQEELDESEPGLFPFYCRKCGTSFVNWTRAKVHAEPAA